MHEPTTPDHPYDFSLPAEAKLLQATVREFAEKEIRPLVMRFDEAQSFPKDIVRAMGNLGFLGAVVPERLGGAGLSTLEFVLIMEEVARVDPSVALIFAAHSGLCLQHIMMFASADQKARYVPSLATGETIGSWALTEPESGSDSGGMKTSAARDGDGYVLNGSKTFITNGSVAGTFVIMAKTDLQQGKGGISAFIVEGSMGIAVARKENKLGMRASDTVQLVLENVRVPKANLLGREGEGFKQALGVLDSGRIGIAALAVGLAQGALEASVKYAKERRQFGKTLAEFQATQFKLAEMATDIEAARLLTYRAALEKQSGKPYTLVASQAKLFASEAAQRAATEAVQIHGGYGYIKEFPVEKLYRDVKLLTIGEGTSEVQRMVIAKQLLSM
jgi:alkylation response protein AidB-like acyl-CoA dehydrogenase